MKLSSELSCGPAAFVAAHQQIVYTFCYRTLGRVEPAKEVAQQAFERAWDGGQASPPAHPVDARAEALRLLAAAYCEVLWRSSRTRPAPRPAAGDVPGVEALLATLPVESRCAVVLRCCCALTLEEVGTVMGLPLHDVRLLVIQACRGLVPYLCSAHDTLTGLGVPVAAGHPLRHPMSTLQEEVSNVSP